jgi:hypothetical protein
LCEHDFDFAETLLKSTLFLEEWYDSKVESDSALCDDERLAHVHLACLSGCVRMYMHLHVHTMRVVYLFQ